ncbi:hypothetical protein C0J52_13783 [Blattella germanica]|nr:hypothetical protein C0J52_13783 [Blattella germanica]
MEDVASNLESLVRKLILNIACCLNCYSYVEGLNKTVFYSNFIILALYHVGLIISKSEAKWIGLECQF